MNLKKIKMPGISMLSNYFTKIEPNFQALKLEHFFSIQNVSNMVKTLMRIIPTYCEFLGTFNF